MIKIPGENSFVIDDDDRFPEGEYPREYLRRPAARAQRPGAIARKRERSRAQARLRGRAAGAGAGEAGLPIVVVPVVFVP